MAKDAIPDYDSATPGNNTDIGGVNVAEGMLPSLVNNAMRELCSQVKDHTVLLGTTGGSANAYTFTFNQVPSAYATGMVVRCKIHAANTGSSTINVNSLGTKTIKSGLSDSIEALAGGELPINYVALLVYDGTDFLLLNPANKYHVVQRKLVSATGIFGTGTTTPFDDTIPQQSTEGATLGVDLAWTPKYADSKTRLSWMLPTISMDTTNALATLAVHQDATEDAIFACPVHHRTSVNLVTTHSGFIIIDSTDTSARTYKLHLGASSGNVWCNADNGSSVYSTVDNTRWFMAEELYHD